MAAFDHGPLSKYNSLTDKNLVNYFSNDRMKRHLVKSGLITRQGEIITESEYKIKIAHREHRRKILDMIAQATIHKALEMERSRQIDIGKKIEEIAKSELVKRVKTQRDKADNDDFTEKDKRSKERSFNKTSHSDIEELRLHSSDDNCRKRLRKSLPKEEIDSKHLSALDSMILNKYFKIIESQERKRCNKMPYMETNRELSFKHPRKLKSIKKRRKPVNKSEKKEESDSQNGTSRSAQGKLQSLVTVSLIFHAPNNNRKFLVSVDQQPFGGNTLNLYNKELENESVFEIVSKRHNDYPFSLTLYIDGVTDCRISTCCEYKHKQGTRIGGSNGHFTYFQVKGKGPCYRCLAENDLKQSKTGKTKSQKSSEGKGSVQETVSVASSDDNEYSEDEFEELPEEKERKNEEQVENDNAENSDSLSKSSRSSARSNEEVVEVKQNNNEEQVDDFQEDIIEKEHQNTEECIPNDTTMKKDESNETSKPTNQIESSTKDVSVDKSDEDANNARHMKQSHIDETNRSSDSEKDEVKLLPPPKPVVVDSDSGTEDDDISSSNFSDNENDNQIALTNESKSAPVTKVTVTGELNNKSNTVNKPLRKEESSSDASLLEKDTNNIKPTEVHVVEKSKSESSEDDEDDDDDVDEDHEHYNFGYDNTKKRKEENRNQYQRPVTAATVTRRSNSERALDANSVSDSTVSSNNNQPLNKTPNSNENDLRLNLNKNSDIDNGAENVSDSSASMQSNKSSDGVIGVREQQATSHTEKHPIDVAREREEEEEKDRNKSVYPNMTDNAVKPSAANDDNDVESSTSPGSSSVSDDDDIESSSVTSYEGSARKPITVDNQDNNELEQAVQSHSVNPTNGFEEPVYSKINKNKLMDNDADSDDDSDEDNDDDDREGDKDDDKVNTNNRDGNTLDKESNEDISISKKIVKEVIADAVNECNEENDDESSDEITYKDVFIESEDISYKKAKAICASFENEKIRSFTIKNCDLESHIFDSISDKLAQHNELESICLSNCEIEISLLRILSNTLPKWPSLNAIILSHNEMTDYSLQNIIDTIGFIFKNDGSNTRTMKLLDLSYCTIQLNDFSTITDLIGNNNRIEKVVLSGNYIDSIQWTNLLNALYKNKFAKAVVVKDCKITDDMMKEIDDEGVRNKLQF